MLVSCGNVPWTNNIAVESPAGQLDIAYNHTYTVVNRVNNEISSLFNDNIFHVGGDEINELCYNHSKYIQDWFKNNSLLSLNDLLQYCVDKSLPIFRNQKTKKVSDVGRYSH